MLPPGDRGAPYGLPVAERQRFYVQTRGCVYFPITFLSLGMAIAAFSV